MNAASKVIEAIEGFGKRTLGNIKVMIVDDVPIITQLVTSLLSREGCVPYSTLSSTEAINLAERFMPDVIILDLMMPDLSGEVLLTLFKGHDTLKNIPVVVFTNKGDEADRASTLKLGASEYLIKASTDLPRLIAVVKKLAQRSE